MIDINTYRSRIGQFSQKISPRKYLYRREYYYKNCWNENKAGKNALIMTKSLLKLIKPQQPKVLEHLIWPLNKSISYLDHNLTPQDDITMLNMYANKPEENQGLP